MGEKCGEGEEREGKGGRGEEGGGRGGKKGAERRVEEGGEVRNSTGEEEAERREGMSRREGVPLETTGHDPQCYGAFPLEREDAVLYVPG